MVTIPAPPKRALFGGAMAASIPASFIDISSVREIPDNQEVFSDAKTDSSIIIELLEPPSHPPSELPSTFHFNALASDAQAAAATLTTSRELPRAHAHASLLEADANLSISYAEGTSSVAKYRDPSAYATTLHVELVCLRIARVNTDVLLTLNEPLVLHPHSTPARGGASAPAPGTHAGVLAAVLGSLVVNDWGLFGA